MRVGLVLMLLAIPSAAYDTGRRKASWREFTWADFGVGSYARYKSKISLDMRGGAPFGIETEMKYTLKELSSTEATVVHETQMNGQPQDSTETKYPFTGRSAEWIQNATPKAEGKEYIESCARRIPCRWVDYTMEAGGSTLEYRLWTSYQVPTSIVRMVMKGDGATKYDMTMELVEFEKK